MKKFLTAEWRDLIMINYEVDPALLRSRIPAGTELDLHDGKCFVSLVGFMFLNTRVMEFLIPFHVNFEEVNLRFYVRRIIDTEVRRGVVFIKEVVPRAAIAIAARAIYGEPYERWTMANERTADRVAYHWRKGETANSIAASRGAGVGVPEQSSHGEFMIEHYWGYTKQGSRTVEYRVEHPKWELFETSDVRANVDFGATYGEEFAALSSQSPYSVLLANGSDISVFKGERIK